MLCHVPKTCDHWQNLGQPGPTWQPTMDSPSNTMEHWTQQLIGNQKGRMPWIDCTLIVIVFAKSLNSYQLPICCNEGILVSYLKFGSRMGEIPFLTTHTGSFYFVHLRQRICTESIASQLRLANFWGKKRSNNSNVWDHFGFQCDANGVILDKTKAVCRHCSTEVKYVAGSTSNLTSHYSNHVQGQKGRDIAALA